jgi:hypothetical protein
VKEIVNDIYEDIHDVPLIDKAQNPLYIESKACLLSTMLLLLNFKVMNGISNTCMACIIRYEILLFI